MSTTPSQRGTQHRKIRMSDDLWDALGELAEAERRDRSAVLRDLAEGYVKRRRRAIEREERMRAELRAVTRAG